MDTPRVKLVYSPQEWAEITGLNLNTVYGLIQAGRYGNPEELRHGRRYLIPFTALGVNAKAVAEG